LFRNLAISAGRQNGFVSQFALSGGSGKMGSFRNLAFVAGPKKGTGIEQ
jgi:hypothetical protein